MKKQLLLLGSLCLLIFSCTEKERSAKAKVRSGNVVIEEKIKKKAENIMPYVAPKNLAELQEFTYLVDTLYRQTIANQAGNDDDAYQIVFNKIVAQTKSKKYHRNQIRAVRKNAYFDPVFRTEDKRLILPFFVDEEREWLIFVNWLEKEGELVFQSYFKNLFISKYANISILDAASKKDKDYLLIEKQLMGEGGMDRKIWLARIVEEELDLLKKYDLGKFSTDTLSAKYSFQILKDKMQILEELPLKDGRLRTSILDEF